MARTPKPLSSFSAGSHSLLSHGTDPEDNSSGSDHAPPPGAGGGSRDDSPHHHHHHHHHPPPPPGGATTATASSSTTASATAGNRPQAYAIPQWLVPERRNGRYFSVAFPPVPAVTREAVRSHVSQQERGWPGDGGGTTPGGIGIRGIGGPAAREVALMTQQVRDLQQEQKARREAVRAAKDRLAQALVAKSEGLAEVRKRERGGIEEALATLEKTMRDDQEMEYRRVEEEIQRQVASEYERKFEEDRKRKREDEKEEVEEDGGEDLEEEGREKADQGGADRQASSAKEDGANRDAEVIDDETRQGEEIIEEQKLGKEKLEELAKKKKEMLWLLKQVIKAETKQKMMERMKQKKLEAAKQAL